MRTLETPRECLDIVPSALHRSVRAYLAAFPDDSTPLMHFGIAVFFITRRLSAGVSAAASLASLDLNFSR